MDIHVCRDKEELDRLVFFNSYGDLGMIMGLVASNIGLKLSSKGLFVSIHRTTMHDFPRLSGPHTVSQSTSRPGSAVYVVSGYMQLHGLVICPTCEWRNLPISGRGISVDS